jgi:hypothetical protein
VVHDRWRRATIARSDGLSCLVWVLLVVRVLLKLSGLPLLLKLSGLLLLLLLKLSGLPLLLKLSGLPLLLKLSGLLLLLKLSGLPLLLKLSGLLLCCRDCISTWRCQAGCGSDRSRGLNLHLRESAQPSSCVQHVLISRRRCSAKEVHTRA